MKKTQGLIKKIMHGCYNMSLMITLFFLMKKVNIGGQAVIEGVMMKSKDTYSVAVRKPDKEIIIEKKEYTSLTKRYKILGCPILRGAVIFFESMVMGMKILTFSAEFMEIDDEEVKKSKFEEKIESKYGEQKLKDILIGISVVIASCFSIGLFILLPAFISGLLKPLLPSANYINLIDGVLRIIILLTYMLIISRLKDIQRVFMYHGAEHKSIHCLEAEKDLTIENVKNQSRFHKRCGTNFIFIVVFISMFILMLFNVETFWLRIGVRLLLLPLISGVSYELLKGLGKRDTILTDIVSAPGLLLQRLTTIEPDDDQIEVAIAALNSVLKDEKNDIAAVS